MLNNQEPPFRARSMLFVPATRPDRVVKAVGFGPDTVIVDLEDAVGPAEKDAARAQAREAMDTLDLTGSRTRVYLRMNAVGTPWFEADAVSISPRAAGLVLPKAECPEDITAIRDLVRVSCGRQVGMVLGIESARGLARVEELCRVDGVSAVYFGSEDYITDLGGRRTVAGAEILYPRSQVALAARLAGIPAIDQAILDVGDGERFAADASQGRDLGYQGKLCIHPSQVALAHAAFDPSPAEIDFAVRVMAAVDRDSSGVAVLDGQMVDRPHVERARALLALAAPDSDRRIS